MDEHAELATYRVIRELVARFEIDVPAASEEEAEIQASFHIARLPIGHAEWRTVAAYRISPRSAPPAAPPNGP